MSISRRVVGVVVAMMSVAFLAGVGCEEVPPGHDMDLELSDAEMPGHYGITGGTPTGYNTWKGVIAVYNNQSGTLCTGTFIDEEVILTAGHCVYNLASGINILNSPGSVMIFGGADIDIPAQVVWYFQGASAIVDHPAWTGNINDASSGAIDLALIHVAGSAYSPLPEIYAVRSTSASVGESGTVVGYGNNVTGSGAGIHRSGSTNVIGVWTNYLEIGGESGTCQGDSGGPFFTTTSAGPAVTGVTSFGFEYCLTSEDNYSVHVSQSYSWIDDQVMTWTGHGLGQGSDTDVDSDTDSDADSDSDSDTDSDADSDSDADTDLDGDGDTDGDDEDFNAFGMDNTNPITSCSAVAAGRLVSNAGMISVICALI